MFKYLVAGTLVLLPTSLSAGPFGVEMGQKVSTLAAKPSSVNGAYKVTVPTPVSEFESYTALSTPETGVCKIWGVGKNHENDRYGSSVQGAFNRLKEALNNKYGTGKDYQFLKAGALWDGSHEWVMAVKQNERRHVTIWVPSEGAKLPSDLTGITLEVQALSSTTSYIDLTYEFANFQTCKRSFAAKDNDGL